MVDKQAIQDLKEYLSLEAKAECREEAAELVAGLSGKTDGAALIRDTDGLLDLVVSLKDDTNKNVAKSAYKCLINVAADPKVCQRLLDVPNFLKEILEYVIGSESDFADGVCMLFINLSHYEDCAERIVETIIQNSDTIGFNQIIQAFTSINHNPKNSLHDLGPFLQNLSQVKAARHYIMDKERCVIQRLLPFTEYKDSINRRKGIVGLLKNCCFETDYHEWLLGPAVDILPRLLLPLAGPEEFKEDDMERLPDELQYLDCDKTREEDPEIRKMLVEAVIKLCSTQKGRLFVKDKNTYVIMREYHKWETVEDNNDTIQECVNLLIMDEPQEGMEDLESFEIPQEIQDRFNEIERKQGGKMKTVKKNADGSQWVKF